MPLTRAWEEHEVPSDLRRLYGEVRASFDIPFVPTIFKQLAGAPSYLKPVWDDLEPVARSREFRAATQGLEEFVRARAIRGGWRLRDQSAELAGHKFATPDVEVLGAMIRTFVRVLPQMVLLARLLQRGYSGGQRGKVSAAKYSAALARIVTLNVPNEREAGLRVWLIYSDFKRTMGASSVPSLLRVLSPFPGYLASVWTEGKDLMAESSFQRARDEVTRRALGYVVGLPVRDHRAVVKGLAPGQWRQIEELVDGYARLLPQMALFAAAWERSFPQLGTRFSAA